MDICARELAEKLLEHPDMKVRFRVSEVKAGEAFPTIQDYSGIEVMDIGYSDGVILLSGEPEQ